MIPSVKFLREIFFFRVSPSVIPLVFGFLKFLTKLATEWKITDDQYFDGRILSVKMLPTVCVPHTDGMNPSIKLFDGVVLILEVAESIMPIFQLSQAAMQAVADSPLATVHDKTYIKSSFYLVYLKRRLENSLSPKHDSSFFGKMEQKFWKVLL